nr:asparaginase [Halobellus ruber]
MSTGGTIASTHAADGAKPTLPGEELVAAADLPTDLDLSVEQVSQVPGFGMDTDIVDDVASYVRDAGADESFVVTHGTDTMAESAYYLDAGLAPDAPVVFTGAQRRPDEVSADGPANLRAAVAAATHPELYEAGGTHLAFNGELHAARDVVKSHSHKLETFSSPGKGPVAVRNREGFRFHREPGSRSAHVPGLGSDATVATVTSGLGVDGGPVRWVLDAVDGLVVAGTGLGNVTAELADAIDEALDDGVPVVIASRCHAGGVNGVYGTAGGGKRLLERGVLPAGDLPPWKARLKLLLALEAANTPAGVAEYF